jgi:hypothetical protein
MLADVGLLGYNALWTCRNEWIPAFWRYILLPSSRLKVEPVLSETMVSAYKFTLRHNQEVHVDIIAAVRTSDLTYLPLFIDSGRQVMNMDRLL